MAKIEKIRILSFGHKYGETPAANLVFDVRFIKNPYYLPELRPLTGLDQPVNNYILRQKRTRVFLRLLKYLINESLSGYLLEGNNHQVVTIAFGCSGGKHRSVCLAQAATTMVKQIVDRLGLTVEMVTEHRDMGRE